MYRLNNVIKKMEVYNLLSLILSFILPISLNSITGVIARGQNTQSCDSKVSLTDILPRSDDAVFEKPKHSISLYAIMGVGGFIPLQESYRLNYSTNLGGLPIEVDGGFIFPVTDAILTPVIFRYERRTANFIDGTSIAVFSIEPGIRFYLEPQHDRDFRIFGAVEGLLAQANVTSTFEALADANSIVALAAPVMKDYFDFGIGFDIGLVYPLTETTALDGTVHTAIYFGSPVTSGGIGNIGGVSLSIAYRFGF
jgi:hypothetical protein